MLRWATWKEKQAEGLERVTGSLHPGANPQETYRSCVDYYREKAVAMAVLRSDSSDAARLRLQPRRELAGQRTNSIR